MEEILYYNPYLHNHVISDPNKLFGRGEFYKRIYAAIAASGSFSLLGPPRIGKGSLLYCLRFPSLQQRYAKVYMDKLSRCLFVFVDIRSHARKSWDDFFKALNKEIIAQCRDTIPLNVVASEGSEGFTSLLDEITDQSYHLVLSFDSFEKLRENERLSGLLPSFLRSESYRISYVVASTIPLYDIFPHEPRHSQFYNIFLYHDEEIGPLTPTDSYELVTLPAKDAGLPFLSEESDWIIKQGGLHPSFLRRICQALFDQKVASPGTPLNLEQMESPVYKALLPQFMSLWENMSERQKEQMSYRIQEGKIGDFYESALFYRFVKTQCEEKISIGIKDIKDALKKIGDLSQLGGSRLRHLEVVRAHLHDHPQPLPSEIGFSIRAILYLAHEHLKGQGNRTDTARDWETFNILYYCYFKHHMHNTTLSMRLGMSTRTLYRKKEVALKDLLTALREMKIPNHNS